jgi:hypothetical protein
MVAEPTFFEALLAQSYGAADGTGTSTALATVPPYATDREVQYLILLNVGDTICFTGRYLLQIVR